MNDCEDVSPEEIFQEILGGHVIDCAIDEEDGSMHFRLDVKGKRKLLIITGRTVYAYMTDDEATIQ